ncbi:hypothetical protein RB24_26555 [Herbaspirillum rubrisubalbicans]|uniref:Uncharacterized protein n=1 Tax=Herbaspirillum rubrisubalbicans TaxID=80842 RepID=A0ABX9BTY3_9BURK|nr:hypothetical protein RB24_26555 [Herbaspirillum rubrisubalbicans]
MQTKHKFLIYLVVVIIIIVIIQIILLLIIIVIIIIHGFNFLGRWPPRSTFFLTICLFSLGTICSDVLLIFLLQLHSLLLVWRFILG